MTATSAMVGGPASGLMGTGPIVGILVLPRQERAKIAVRSGLSSDKVTLNWREAWKLTLSRGGALFFPHRGRFRVSQRSWPVAEVRAIS